MFSTNIHEKFAQPLSESVYVVLVISTLLHVVNAIVSTSGNMLVVSVYGKRLHGGQTLRPPDLLVLNLAISDVAVGLFLLPLMIVTDIFILLGRVLFLRAVLESFFMPFLSSVSIWTVFGTSIDRFISIKWPHTYKTTLHRARVRKWICFTWLYASTWIWFPFLPGSGTNLSFI